MKVGIVDVGSNTVRLLVARRQGGELVALREEREHLFLGEDVERDGRLSHRPNRRGGPLRRRLRPQRPRSWARGDRRDRDRARAPERERRPARPRARRRHRRARPRAQRGRGGPARVRGGGRRRPSSLPAIVAVCDVGGGSAEAVVGTPEGGPAWSRSLDVGAVRLTERFLADDPPGRQALAAAQRRGRACTSRRSRRRSRRPRWPPVAPPARSASSSAGSSRAEEFDAALRILGKRPSGEGGEDLRIARAPCAHAGSGRRHPLVPPGPPRRSAWRSRAPVCGKARPSRSWTSWPHRPPEAAYIFLTQCSTGRNPRRPILTARWVPWRGTMTAPGSSRPSAIAGASACTGPRRRSEWSKTSGSTERAAARRSSPCAPACSAAGSSTFRSARWTG